MALTRSPYGGRTLRNLRLCVASPARHTADDGIGRVTNLVASMPKGGTLVNTARKEVIDEAGADAG